MKKRLLFLIPIVFLILFLIMILNNKTIKVEDFKTKKLTSYVDVLDDDKNIEGTDNVKFDAYFLVDKDNDSNLDKIRGNNLSLNQSGTLNIDLNVTNGAILKDVKILFINSNVRVAYKGSYESEISLNTIESGTNRDLKITIKPSLTNDFSSYSSTNKVKLTGTLVENGQEKEISKEVSYILDWYSTGVRANIERKYTKNVEVKDDKIIVTYKFSSYANPYNMLKSVNLTAYIPSLNDIYPTKVVFNGNYYVSNYDEETHKLTVVRNAQLEETMLVNSAYDYRDGDMAFNNYEIALEYPIEAGMKDADLHLNTSVYYEQYNNPESTPQIFTSNVASYIFTAVYKAEDAVTEVTGNGITPYIISARTNMYSQALDKSPVYNLYDGLEADKTTEFNYDLDVQFYYSLGKVNKIIAYDADYNRFSINDSMMNFVKYKSLRFKNNLESLFGTNGYIKMINGETNEVIHIFSVSDWNEIYTFENDVRKIYFETSGVVNGIPCNVKYDDRNKPYCSYTTALSINVTKEIDNEIIVSTYTKEQYDRFSSINSKFNTNMEAENISITYLEDEVTNSHNTDYELPKSSGVEISIDKNSISNNETVNAKIKISTGRYSTGTTRYGWKNGEFLVEFPQEIINIKVNSVSSSCIGGISNLDIEGYELKKINGLNTIKILTTNSTPINFCDFNIDADITVDPRTSDKNVSISVYGLNKYYDLSDWQALDKYDLNDNGSVEDYVNFGSTSMYILADDEIRTVTTLRIYDENNNEIQTIPPVTAEVNPISDNDTAKVEIGVYNNSAEGIKDLVIIGKTGYIGNTYQLRNEDLGSEFDAPMTSSGITVPNEIIDKTIVYYSTETNPSDDINNLSNNWKTKDNVTDFNDIKSYMIIVSDYTVGVGSNVSFTYDVNIPTTTNLLYKTTYFTHAVYYNKVTDGGVIGANPIEQRKTSLMITRKYNLSLTDYKTSSNSPIKGSTYLLIDEEGNTNIIKTNGNGKYLLEGLYVNKEYKLVQKNVNYPFVLDEEEKKFTVINNTSDQLELTNLTGTYKTSVIEDSTLKLTLENETRYDLVLRNTDIDTLELIPKSSFKITGKGYEEGKVLRTNNDGELSLKGLYLDNEYTIEQISSIKHLKLIEPFKFYIKRDANGDIAIAHNDVLKDYGIPKLFYNSTSNTFEHSIYNDGSTLYTKGSGDSEEYIELDLTGYSSNDFKIKYYSDKGPYYGSNYICIFDEIDGILDHYSNYYQACLNATYSLSNGEGYINTYYSYNESINDFEGHPLVGGKKYYMYMYMYVNWAEIRLYPIERVDGEAEKPIYTSKTNVPSDENSNIFLTIEDDDNLEAPKFTIDIKSRLLPTINFELTKVSADTKEPLKNAQYKIIGFGTSINGDYLKTDENGKATMVLNNTVAMKSNTRYKTIINEYDYSVLGDYYSIQEVVPPIGYQIDTRKIDFRVIDKYENTNCEDSNNDQITRCEIDSSTPHSYTLDTKSITNQFAEYEFDESTNTLKVTMYDYPLVSISKKDAETGELLPNTLFAVYSVSYDLNGSEVLEPAKDSNGNILGVTMKINDEYVNVLSTDENGRIVVALNSGKYMAKEVQTTDEKYKIDDQIYYFTIGPTIEYDDTKLKYFGSIYSEYTTFNWYDNTQSADGGPYTEVIPTSDGGWLVSTDNNNRYDFDNWIISIKKYDKDLNLEWESDAKPYLKSAINQYRYYDDPERIINVDIDTSLASYSYYDEARTHLSESEDGYYVNTHYIGVIKFDKNGNRLWQSRDGNINLTYYTAVCSKLTEKPVNPNEYVSDYNIIPYDSTNPYIQKDENTYYCSTGTVYDATLETVGGTLRWLVYANDGTPTESRPDPKYDDTQYNSSSNEFEYEYDDEGHIIGTSKVYTVQTPYVSQPNNIIRGEANYMNFSSSPGYDETGGTLFISATPDNGVTLYVDGYYGGYVANYILADGTLISYGVWGDSSAYRRKGNECNMFNSAYFDRSECNLHFASGAYVRYKNLLHYSSDGKLVSADNMGRILYYAITKYNEEHPDKQMDPYIFENNAFDDTEMMYTFENGDLLFLNHNIGLVRITYNEQTKHYEPVYIVPKSDLSGAFTEYTLGYSMEEIQLIGNSIIVRENKAGKTGRTTYFIDENGNVSEEVTLFGENDSFNYKPRFADSRNINGFYKLDNGNYIVYTQINKIDQYSGNGLLEDSITLGLNNQYIYKKLNLKDKHLYFIIYEMNPESKILWYKLYDITKEGSTLNEQYTPSSENYIYSPIKYNKESNELMFIVQHEQNFPMTNVDEPSETYTADGNMLVFKLSDETRPEAPEAYSIEVLNERKKFNINIESKENGKAYVLNGDNTVYTLNNETKSVENIKYGDNSIYTIKAKGNDGYTIDKVLLNDEEYSYTALDDGTIILDGIKDVQEEKNIKITFKPANGIVIVHHYIKDTEEKIASDEIIPATTGMLYETEPALNELYSLVKDSNGEYILPSNYKDFFMANPTVVTYYYEENNVNLKTNYYKENSTIELAPSKVERKLLGSSYKTSPMNIEFYELVKVIGEEEGTLNKENTEVTYMYEETYDVNLKVKYIEKETEKELSDSVNKTLKRHDSYETEAKEIENYKLVDKTSNYKGKAENQEIEVIYYYEKIKSKITTRYIEKETNKEIIEPIIKEVDINSIYITERKGFEGYKLIDNTDNINGLAEELEIEVIYYYEKIKEDPEEPKPDDPVIPKPIPNIPIKIKEKVELIISSNIDISTTNNNNNLEIIKEETEKDKKIKETNSNLIVIIILGLITIIGFIIGKLKSDNNI